MSVVMGTGRSVEEIDAILSAAKLNRKELLPVAQVGKFTIRRVFIYYSIMYIVKVKRCI